MVSPPRKRAKWRFVEPGTVVPPMRQVARGLLKSQKQAGGVDSQALPLSDATQRKKFGFEALFCEKKIDNRAGFLHYFSEMKKFLIAVLLAISTFAASAQVRPELLNIYNSTVIVDDGEGVGSGVVFRTKTGEVLVWSCAHVIWDTQSKPAKLVQSALIDGKKAREIVVFADVIAVSHPTRGYDLAILRPRDQKAFTNFAVFYSGVVVPAVGTPIVHCGSPRGYFLERSITFGTVAGIARSRHPDTFSPLDQSTATAAPGSSGGGIFLISGELIGLVSEWEGLDNLNLFVPVRSMARWAVEEKHPEWVGLDK